MTNETLPQPCSYCGEVPHDAMAKRLQELVDSEAALHRRALAAEQRAEQNAKDAERYRLLRTKGDDWSVDHLEFIGDVWYSLYGDELDAALDADLKETQ